MLKIAKLIEQLKPEARHRIAFEVNRTYGGPMTSAQRAARYRAGKRVGDVTETDVDTPPNSDVLPSRNRDGISVGTLQNSEPVSHVSPGPPSSPAPKILETQRNGSERQTRSRTRPVRDYPPGFQAFWAAYPHKIAKDDAVLEWQQKACEPQAEMIVAAVVHQRKWLMRGDAQRGKNPGDLCPYPATWLRAGRWQDEVPEVQTMVPTALRRSMERS